MRTFVDSLNKSLADTSARSSGVADRRLTTSRSAPTLRYSPTYSGELKPFVGVGVAAHVINAEGKLIKGTFVERSLDDIAFGVYGTAGIAIRISRSVGVEGLVRGDLVGGLRSVQARAGGTYYFGHIRGM